MSAIDWSSAVDWSKAPADATHYGPNSDAGLRACWYKMEEGEWFYLTEAQDFGDSATWQRSRVDREDKVERPKQWDGEGLPPVGTVCEAYWASDTKPQWFKFNMLFLGDEHAVANVEGDENHYTRSILESGKVQFRPIKTPEQIAAEERESHVLGMLCHDALGNSRRGLAEALYDAGYRKQEVK